MLSMIMRKSLWILIIFLALIAAGAKLIFAVGAEPYYRAKIISRPQPEPPGGPAQPEAAPAGPAAKQEPQQFAAPASPAAAVQGQPGPGPQPEQRQSQFPVIPDHEYDSAMELLNTGDYQAAREKFNAICDQAGVAPERKEKSRRRIADCLFHIGKKGSNQDLLRAAELYKELVTDYPASRAENALAVYRLAKSYEGLNFYYEARKEYERLAAAFPESPDVPEALFKAGEMSYRVRQFSAAAGKLKQYIEQHPSGDHVKESYFMIADCYSQLQYNDISSAWYQEILKRWPEWEKIPPDELYKLGSHYFRSGKCRDAIEIFTLMLSMRPGSAGGTDVCLMTARCLLETGQVRTALKMFSHIIATYPESQQAPQAMIFMANLGVEHPAVRIPLFMPGSPANRDPVQTYNDLLAKYPFHEFTEELLFHKGFALYEYGRIDEAFNTFRYEAFKYPQGRFKTECMINLLQCADILMKRAYAQHDYLSVTDIFLKVENDFRRAAPAGKLEMVAESFQKIGINKEAISLYNEIIKSGKVAESPHLKFKKAESHFFNGDLDEAEKLFAGALENYRKDKVSTAYCKKYLGDISLKKRAYDRAAAYYTDALAAKADFADGAALQRNMALALAQAGLYSKALPHFQNAATAYNSNPGIYGPDVFIDAYIGMGECLLRERRFKESLPYFKRAEEGIPGGGEVLWPLLGQGKVYLSMRNTDQADKVFEILREKGGEEFWAKIADYTVQENAWATQYGRFLGK